MSTIPAGPMGMPDTDELKAKLKMNGQLEKLGNLKTAKNADPAKAKAAAEEFESVFLTQMMQHMFAGIETDEVTGGGESEDVYRSMMVEQYGKQIQKAGGIGIASTVYDELMKHQEIESKGTKK